MEDQDLPVVFSQWLKLRRKALDMTQAELAERAGCSLGALRKIEAGERRPSKQLAELMAKALEVSDQDLPTFIRVARGELNIERLQPPPARPLPPIPTPWNLTQQQSNEAHKTRSDSASPASRIPLPTTALVGRETELAALERLFADPQCRLLTLTGIGGIGKTRLAIEFAIRNLPAFPGGVFYLPLASVTSSEKVVPAIADILDFRFSGPTDPEEQLFNYLAIEVKQEALFILDNLEHLLNPDMLEGSCEGLVGLISEMLQRLQSVKILGTSRERLDLHGEWTYELHGLSSPPAGFKGRLETYHAIELFEKSARHVRADFRLTAGDQENVVRICRLVEGVPLAIELAAAWVGLLATKEIADEIQENMDFLATSMRDIPERHRSIRATFDHSWKLLSEEEQKALCRLSVFRGGFDREAAQRIASASLPLLASLSAKSLVRRTDAGRFDLHEVIRQYAFSHLTGQPFRQDVHARHAAYYLNFVGDCAGLLKTASQQAVIHQLSGEIDNLRKAWLWAIDQRNFDLLGKAGRGFGWYFEITGLYNEGIEQFELLVRALVNGSQDEQRRKLMALALIHQALLHFRKGDFDQACRLYEESVLILRPIGDQILLADALIFWGTILHMQGEYERSRAAQQEGLTLARLNKERWLEAFAIFNLGYVDSLLGRYAEGYEQLRAGLDTWRELGDPQAIAMGMNFLAPTLNKLGRFEEAKALMMESIALCEQSKNRWGMATAYRHLGLAYLAAGEIGQAQDHLQTSLEIFGQFAQGWDIAKSLAYLGDAARMAGDSLEAGKYYRKALQCSMEEHLIPMALDALTGLAELQAQAGNLEHTLLLCCYILNHPACEEETKHRTGLLYATLEPQLDSGQIETARWLAREKSLDRIVTETLASA